MFRATRRKQTTKRQTEAIFLGNAYFKGYFQYRRK